METLYTPEEVAGFLRISRRMVYYLMDRRELAFTKVGGRRRISNADLQNYHQRMHQEANVPDGAASQEVAA